jgi:hypothetical protein
MRDLGWILRLGLLPVVLGIGVSSNPAHAAGTLVVKTMSPDVWFGLNEGPAGSVGASSFVPGPGAPPLGGGSAQLVVDSAGRASFGTELYKGTPLSSITTLTYSSYSSSVATLSSPSFQIEVDYDATDASTTYQGRLVYEPGAPPADAWVASNALTGALWWATAAPGNSVCSQGDPCTWSELTTAFPNAAVRNDPSAGGAVLFRVGGPIAGGSTVYVDDLTISAGSDTTTYDFEAGASVLPSVASAGAVVVIRAYGFKPNTNVKAYYYTNARPRRVRLCQAPASSTGAFECAVPLPTDLAGPAGVHNVRIQGRTRVRYDTAVVLTP